MVKTIVRMLGGLALFFCAATVALFLLHPRIPLGFLSSPLSSLLTRLTGSEQVISGNYFLVPGAWTTFFVENGSVKLTGSQGFRLTAAINSAQTTVHLWSLFRREISLDRITVHGLVLDLFSGEPKETFAPGVKHKKSNQGEFVPFTLKQTGVINLAEITATITAPEPDRQVTFLLAKGAGEINLDTPGECTLEGMVNGRNFKSHLEVGPLGALSTLNAEWPFAFRLSHKSLAAAVTGSVRQTDAQPRMIADISLTGEHFDDLTSILGVQGSRNQPVALQGSVALSMEELRADFSRLQMGREILAFSASVENYRSQEPRYTFTIRDDILDLDALKGFLSAEDKKATRPVSETGTAKISRDDVIFPSTFPITNFTLDLDLGEIVMAGSRAKSIRLNTIMTDGVVEESPFALTFKNASLAGDFSFNVNKRIPQLSIHYDTNSFDIGAFLKDLKLADDIVMHIENASTDLKTRGRTLAELFDNFEFAIAATGGEYEYRDPNTGAVLPVHLENTRITGVPGEKIIAAIQGAIGESPVMIKAELDDRRDEPPESVKEVPVTLHVEIAGTQLTLTGKIPLPFRKEGAVLHSSLTGERLSSVNELLRLQLPELGPYEIIGSLRIDPQGYFIDGIKVQVGSSVLSGDIAIDTKAVPPEVRIGLGAQRIQLDDFDALLLRSQGDESADQQPTEDIQSGTAEKLNSLTDQAVLDTYNAAVDIEVREVLSGADHLGSGTLRIDQRQGQFKVDPLEIQLPGGTFKIDFSVRPSAPDRLYTLNMRIEDFDYGFMARLYKPDTDMSGIINLRASLESISPDRANIMANGSGYLDFAVQPRQLRSGVIDLWAVNIFSYLVPFLAPKGESTINCAAGRLNLMDGILSQDELIIDTSKIRVKGKVEVDFRTQLIDATFRPIPKRPQFYSLATPVKIQGKLSDLDAGVPLGGVAGTIIRLATSYIVVPLQWVIQNKLPEDGTADCLRLLEERTE